MINRLISILFVVAVVVFSSCSGNGKENAEEKDSATVKQYPSITVADFDTKASEFVNKEIKIEGTVSHICKHGGKKLFLFTAPNEDIMVEVSSENSFAEEIVGSDVVIIAKVLEEVVTAEDVAEMESTANSTESETCDTETKAKTKGEVKQEEGANMEVVNYYKDLMKVKNTDKLSFYTLECISYKVKK